MKGCQKIAWKMASSSETPRESSLMYLKQERTREVVYARCLLTSSLTRESMVPSLHSSSPFLTSNPRSEPGLIIPQPITLRRYISCLESVSKPRAQPNGRTSSPSILKLPGQLTPSRMPSETILRRSLVSRSWVTFSSVSLRTAPQASNHAG